MVWTHGSTKPMTPIVKSPLVKTRKGSRPCGTLPVRLSIILLNIQGCGGRSTVTKISMIRDARYHPYKMAIAHQLAKVRVL
jgi:hypothetical protein